jgi:hypothetical protein
MVTMLADSGTLGGSALASWTPVHMLLGAFAAVVVALYLLGRPAERRWAMLQPLSRIPAGLTRVTGVPGWAASAIGLSLFGLLVAGQGFYSDVSWHIALGRDEELFTAPHAAILIGLVLILGGAVVGTFVATMDRVEPAMRVGALRVPRSLLPLWALGLGAVSGFPLDEVWHGEYGIDVTMWSPTHMLMILGATFTGMAAWLILAESGVRPRGGPWARGLHCVAAWLTLQGLVASQGEFTFGVPQFSQLFHPILICLAAGIALVASRLVHGRGWTVGIVTVSFLLMSGGLLDFGSGDEGPVDTRFGGVFIVSALVVEVVAMVLGTDKRARFAVVSGLGIGTIGLGAEWAWNQGAYQRWTTNLLPEALVLGVIAAVGAALLGAAFGRAVAGEGADPRNRIPAPLLAVAAIACVGVVLYPMRRPTGDVEATVRIEPTGDGMAHIVATLSPIDAAEDAYWFQASSWQGGGLELADMEPTGEPGEYRTAAPMPVGRQVDGERSLWKTLLRLHRGAEMMAVPIFLPADEAIGEPEISAVDRTVAFESEREYLLRETTDGNGWLSPVVHGGLVAMTAVWALAFAVAVRAMTSERGQPPASRRRGATRLVSEPIPST